MLVNEYLLKPMVLAVIKKTDAECKFDLLYRYRSFFEDYRFGFLSIKKEDRAKITGVKTEDGKITEGED